MYLFHSENNSLNDSSKWTPLSLKQMPTEATFSTLNNGYVSGKAKKKYRNNFPTPYWTRLAHCSGLRQRARRDLPGWPSTFPITARWTSFNPSFRSSSSRTDYYQAWGMPSTESLVSSDLEGDHTKWSGRLRRCCKGSIGIWNRAAAAAGTTWIKPILMYMKYCNS